MFGLISKGRTTGSKKERTTNTMVQDNNDERDGVIAVGTKESGGDEEHGSGGSSNDRRGGSGGGSSSSITNNNNNNIGNDEKTWLLLSSSSPSNISPDPDEGGGGGGGDIIITGRHESMLPTNTRRQKRQSYQLSRSNTGGYPGIREIDQDNPLQVDPTTFVQDFRDELYTEWTTAMTDYWTEAQNAGSTTGAEDFLLEMTLTRTLSIMPDKQALTDVADGFSDAMNDARHILQSTIGGSIRRQLSSSIRGEGGGEGHHGAADQGGLSSTEEGKLLQQMPPPGPPSGAPPTFSTRSGRKMDSSDFTEETETAGTLTPEVMTPSTSSMGNDKKVYLRISDEEEQKESFVRPDTTDTSLPSTEKAKSRKIPIHAYIILLTAVTALSSIGPFLDRLDGVPAPLRIVWRQQGTALVLWPFALRSLVKDGPPKLSLAQWCTFLLASFSYCVLTVAFSMSVDYTTVNDAAILTNSQSLLLVVAKLCMGSSVHYLESSGVLVAFGGAYLCSRDSSEAVDDGSEDHNPWMSLYGDSLALLSAIGGLGYIMLGKSLRNHVEVYVFMTLNMLVGSTLILSFMTLTGQEWTFDRHIDHGMLGWMNWSVDRIVVELCVVFICNLMGTMGYVRAFKYFSSVIIAVAALLEPV